MQRRTLYATSAGRSPDGGLHARPERRQTCATRRLSPLAQARRSRQLPGGQWTWHCENLQTERETPSKWKCECNRVGACTRKLIDAQHSSTDFYRLFPCKFLQRGFIDSMSFLRIGVCAGVIAETRAVLVRSLRLRESHCSQPLQPDGKVALPWERAFRYRHPSPTGQIPCVCPVAILIGRVPVDGVVVATPTADRALA